MVNHASERLFVSLVEIDHVLFKVSNYAKIFKIKQNDKIEVADHHSCRLGKWYEAYGKEHFGNVKGYGDIVEPHAVVHAKVKEILDNIATHGKVDKKMILKNIADIEGATHILFTTLEEIVSNKFA